MKDVITTLIPRYGELNRIYGKHGKIDPVGTDEIDPVKTA